MNKYNLNATKKEEENKKIKHILHDKKYVVYILKKFTRTEPKKRNTVN
jgi:hypothetical protein